MLMRSACFQCTFHCRRLRMYIGYGALALSPADLSPLKNCSRNILYDRAKLEAQKDTVTLLPTHGKAKPACAVLQRQRKIGRFADGLSAHVYTVKLTCAADEYCRF